MTAKLRTIGTRCTNTVKDKGRRLYSLHTRIEAEHVILAGAYAGTGVIGHDSPALMALAYMVVGTTHVIATRKGKDDKSA